MDFYKTCYKWSPSEHLPLKFNFEGNSQSANLVRILIRRVHKRFWGHYDLKVCEQNIASWNCETSLVEVCILLSALAFSDLISVLRLTGLISAIFQSHFHIYYNFATWQKTKPPPFLFRSVLSLDAISFWFPSCMTSDSSLSFPSIHHFVLTYITVQIKSILV